MASPVGMRLGRQGQGSLVTRVHCLSLWCEAADGEVDCKCLLSDQATLSATFLTKIFFLERTNPLRVFPREHLKSALCHCTCWFPLPEMSLRFSIRETPTSLPRFRSVMPSFKVTATLIWVRQTSLLLTESFSDSFLYSRVQPITQHKEVTIKCLLSK